MREELHPPPERCLCECHRCASPDGIVVRIRADGVSLYDVVEAAVACADCRGKHAVALLSMRLANAPAPRIVDRDAWQDPPRKIEGEDGG